MIYGYGRASRDHQHLTESAQRESCVNYAKQLGLKLDEFFYDHATSGGTELFERPAGLKLYLRLKPSDHIVFQRLDRLFRNGPDGARVMDELISRGIKFSFSNMPGLDTSSPFGVRFCYSELGGAVGEKMVIKERTSDALQVLRKAGKVYNRFVPTGWRRCGKDFKPCPEDRKQTEILFQWQQDGLSLRKSEVKARLLGMKRPRGTHWDRNTISIALKHRLQGYPKIPPKG